MASKHIVCPHCHSINRVPEQALLGKSHRAGFQRDKDRNARIANERAQAHV